MKLIVIAITLAFSAATLAAPPSLDTLQPDWEIIGDPADGELITPSRATLTLRARNPRPLPIQALVQVRIVDDKAWASIAAHGDAKASVVESRLIMRGMTDQAAASAQLTAMADGKPMATEAITSRTWSRIAHPVGNLAYGWRYPRIRNIWTEQDRRDIGADFSALTPFQQKSFTWRLVVTADHRQIWLDDRLVAESRQPATGPLTLSISLSTGAQLEGIWFEEQPLEEDGFLTVPLARHGHDAVTREERRIADPVPLRRLEDPATGIDLGKSLYRYRLTQGTGPDAPYVNGRYAWPTAFTIDPAIASFRVPYRPYTRAHLLVAVPAQPAPESVPAGVFRFYRHMVGAVAASPFQITPEAVAAGDAILTGREGDFLLYRVRAPIDHRAFYGFRDMHDQFLEFQITKPTALGRGYADPIYYGVHPAGPPSSLRILAITLEEAPFEMEVVPEQFGHLFEQPAQPTYAIRVTNRTSQPLPVEAALETVSLDGRESVSESGSATVPPGAIVDIPIVLPVQSLGWHSLTATASSGNQSLAADLSLVLLPPNSRTYGDSTNETRFGAWNLWGHHAGFVAGNTERNTQMLALLRKLGIRRVAAHSSFLNHEMLKEHDFLPKAPHTIVSVYHRLDEKNPEAMQKMVEDELAQVRPLATAFNSDVAYLYGGEWGPSREATHSVWPLYQGLPPRDLTDDEVRNMNRQTIIFTAIGEAMRREFPQVPLILQWGSPTGTIPFMRTGFPQRLVDGYGMDQPIFERLPEHLTDGAIHYTLWQLRAEAKRLDWPELPIHWIEGPFLPTNPGALAEQEQADYQVRLWLLAIAYGVENFEAGIVPFDAANYYGAEHYGAGIFHREPLMHPKPAVAAVSTATSMLCGAQLVGPVDTGSLTNYCLQFRRPDGTALYAMWRIRGTADAQLTVQGPGPLLITDAMGARREIPVAGNRATVRLTSSPLWLTTPQELGRIEVTQQAYPERPAGTTVALQPMTADNWRYDGSEQPFGVHHFGVARAVDPQLTVTLGKEHPDHGSMAEVTLPVQSPDRPLLVRYGTLIADQPREIPGSASHLGVWIEGNSGFGRIVWQLRDAKGEHWISAGTKDDWNADDIHAWSTVCFDGWRYVRFPLPGNHPWDLARTLETTWWGSSGGDGIVDLPLSLETLYVEARNEVPYLNRMTTVPNRTWRFAGLTAEYARPEDATPAALATHASRRPLPEWEGPTTNHIAVQARDGIGEAPVITAFEEPHHWADGRRMIIRFDQQPDRRYNLYLSLYPDGRGAELISHPVNGVADNQLVVGLKPDTPLYLFLTTTTDNQESKPSPPYQLITRDNFAEK